MKTLIVFAVLLEVALCTNVEWEAYKEKHGKVYKDPTEDKFRHMIYLDRVAKINEHNAKFETGKVTYKQGINRFTDMTTLEVREMMNSLDMNLKDKLVRISKKAYKKSGVAVPDSIDWRDYNCVTAVKDQGQCGASWAYSVTGAVEGAWALTTGQLISLSEQQLIDCCRANGGCTGGLVTVGYECLMRLYGIELGMDYPNYDALDGICRYNPANITISGYVELPAYDEGSLLEAAGTVGPISVCIDASHESFQLYSSGVYYETFCSQTNLDQGVLVAGYGTENGLEYWLVKNSWGTSWGEQGYIKMSRDKNNNCGIASSATYPVV